MTAVSKYMDIKEFCDVGYLQEVNRLFFHPRGLALEVTVEEDGTEHLSGVWDYREDPEGIVFAEGVLDPDKGKRVLMELNKRRQARFKLFGGTIQPISHRVEILRICMRPIDSTSPAGTTANSW